MKQITAGIAGVIVLTVIDQLTKLWAIAELKGQPSIIWIKGIFELQYLENRGAAFGLMQNQQWLFLICVAVVFSLIDFPIFNIADIYVTVSMGCFLILFLCYYKEL